MADGRIFTNYQANCQINQDLQKMYGTADIHAYRHYLQTNAEKIMADTATGAKTCTMCPVCEASLSYKPSGNIAHQM